MPDATINAVVEAEETVFSDRYSNNGSGPLWCYNNTCIVRTGDDVFVSATEHLSDALPLNDCRWVLLQRHDGRWIRRHADPAGRQREPCPLVCLDGRVVLSSNPTLLDKGAAGGGPARPELLAFDAAHPGASCRILRPGWRGSPAFCEHTYRTLAADALGVELILFQNVGCSHSEWALLDRSGAWHAGQLPWPAYTATDLAPFGAAHGRVNYPVVTLSERAVHFCGAVSYDNWDRVRTVEDLAWSFDPNGPGSSGMAGRRRGNRFRRLLYAWTDRVDRNPFHDWVEIDRTFDDGGWVFATDMHLDRDGVLHLLWFRSPMLPAVRDTFFPDIRRVYRIEYAALRDGEMLRRRTLLRAGEGEDPAVPTELEQVGRRYDLSNGEWILDDPIATPRFHVTPDGRLFVVYYVSDGRGLSENRILEILADGRPSPPMALPLQHPLTQFFAPSPRAGCAPSWTLDLLGHRRGGWRPAGETGGLEWDGTVSYARVRLNGIEGAVQGMNTKRKQT